MTRARFIVEFWNEEEGWGALRETEETPGGVFVHFSAIQMEGYKALRAGRAVDAVVYAGEQDGYHFSASSVWPL